MKAEELMVGDFILVERNEGIYGGPVWKQPGKVLEIYKDEIKVLFADENGDNEYDEILTFLPHEVDGLLITPEILEKNGFVMDEKDGVAVRYSFATDLHKPKQTVIQFAFYGGGVSADTLFKCWTSPKDCDGINDLHICDLKFIHELQHALRLCGIDKEIKL